jgi:CubicO group peptidase (beta-lactamase class C family)
VSFGHAAALLESGRAAHAFPAAVVEAGRRDRVLWRQAFGHLTYVADAPLTADDTIFDLASLTKVIATTTLVMRAVSAGTIDLDERVADRLAMWRGADREQVTIRDLLAHAAGLTAYLPFFRDHRGRHEFERAICTLPLEYVPRSQAIYSDLGFMLLGFMLEDLGHTPLADQFAVLTADAFPPSAGDVLTFHPARELRDRTAPTELDLWRGRLLQGEVHDENTWALGGAAGHAGVFGTAAAVGTFARVMLDALGGADTVARPDVTAAFTTRTNIPNSSRALGWDTMLPTSSCGHRLSARAIGHTGFTGTSLWIDPDQDLYVVLLTNRVHPTRENAGLQRIRPAVHDAIVDAVLAEGR